MKGTVILFVAFLFISLCQAQWEPVDNALQDGVDTTAYPGCVALVGDAEGPLYFKAFGSYTYGKTIPLNQNTNPPVDLSTLWDMASCTKVTAATSAIAQFYQRGEINLDAPITNFLGQDFAQNGKGAITVLNCLLHNAGFPPDPDPNYWDPAFGCPETSQPFPAENFSCQLQIFNSLLSQTLENPVGAVYVYSDLSFITLQYVVGHVARTLGYVTEGDLVPGCYQGTPASDMCFFEAYVRKFVFQPLGMLNTAYLPAQNLWQFASPAENDTISKQYQKILLQGQVSDGNAYALGGIAGHAGLFSSAGDMFTLGHRIMFADMYNDNLFINSTTATYFTTEYNHTQSCRALGWSTNDPTVYDEGWNLSCGNLSATTWLHIGYTGTQICGDPTRNIVTVFLTNRVYPVPNRIVYQMHFYRQLFNNAVIEVLNSGVSREELRRAGTAHVPPEQMWKPSPTFRSASKNNKN